MPTPPRPLTPDAVRRALPGIPAWRLVEGHPALERTFLFDSFPAAVAFVTRVAFLAEAAGHHPDVDVRFRRVRLVLSTHEAKGVTRRDLDLAAAIDRLAP